MSRVVVAGAGLAGHEVVRRLLADPAFDGTITWHAGEPGHPYNRVLLTDLLAGRHAPKAIELPTLSDPRLTYETSQLRSIAAAEFDHLVLATGAEPVIPPVRGNAVALRTLADVRTILAELDGDLDGRDAGFGGRMPGGARGGSGGGAGLGGSERSGARGEWGGSAGLGSGEHSSARGVPGSGAGLGGSEHSSAHGGSGGGAGLGGSERSGARGESGSGEHGGARSGSADGAGLGGGEHSGARGGSGGGAGGGEHSGVRGESGGGAGLGGSEYSSARSGSGSSAGPSGRKNSESSRGGSSGMAQIGRSLLAGLGGRRHGATLRVAVIGGGPLGVETACALASRGVRVELLHRGPHLLSRWLDAESGALLAGSLTEAGIAVHCDTDVSAATGTWPTAELVILACGVQPRVALARAAGLPIGAGILVDTSGRSLGDERIFAVGDCAETIGVGAAGGALAALEGARRAVAAIGGAPVLPPPPAVSPLRLRTYDIPGADVAVLGGPRAEASIQFTDQRRRTRKVLAFDGDVPVAAALVGDVKAAAALALAIARPAAPAPRSPAALLTSPLLTSQAAHGAGGFGEA
ncbi:NADPH-dependent 2,4-dienoyl-CoA reductase/sulfur reductase-like enzyme [Catenulispora sp. GAS73]|uniref:FAD-dependent oxidoreductase n=1 Tax=Catenulispora sp. GAS73 TaxID=3156269 RepID=UPI003515832A